MSKIYILLVVHCSSTVFSGAFEEGGTHIHHFPSPALRLSVYFFFFFWKKVGCRRALGRIREKIDGCEKCKSSSSPRRGFPIQDDMTYRGCGKTGAFASSSFFHYYLFLTKLLSPPPLSPSFDPICFIRLTTAQKRNGLGFSRDATFNCLLLYIFLTFIFRQPQFWRGKGSFPIIHQFDERERERKLKRERRGEERGERVFSFSPLWLLSPPRWELLASAVPPSRPSSWSPSSSPSPKSTVPPSEKEEERWNFLRRRELPRNFPQVILRTREKVFLGFFWDFSYFSQRFFFNRSERTVERQL